MVVTCKMAGWSDLPEHLLLLIAQRLRTQIDILRLRAVCSSWRSSTPVPKFLLRPLPLKLPLPISAADPDAASVRQGFFALSSDIVYLIQPPRHTGNFAGVSVHLNESDSPTEGWLVRLKEEKPGKLILFSPVTNHRIVYFPETFTRELNLLDFRVTQVCELFNPRFVDKSGLIPGNYHHQTLNSLKVSKVLLSGNLVSIEAPDCVAFAIFGRGRLCFWKLGDLNWTILNRDQDVVFCDIAIRNDKFYAISETGGIVVFGSSFEVVRTIESPLGDVTADVALHLVESFGELLLVVFHGIRSFRNTLRYNERYRYYMRQNDPYRKLMVEVYKLHETELGLMKVNNLGGRALFVSDLGCWAVSTHDFSGCKGNCIYFGCEWSTGIGKCDSRLWGLDYEHMGVFSLDDGTGAALVSYPGYAKMFWPPPSWLTGHYAVPYW